MSISPPHFEKQPGTVRSNPLKEKFLFFFSAEKIEVDSFCGCTLRSGAKISSLILVFIAISNFYTVIKETSVFEILFSLVLSVAYLLSSFYLFYGSLYLEYKQAKIGYIILCLIVYIDILDFIYVNLMIMLGYYSPFDKSLNLLMLVIFICFILFALLIELYLAWLAFSFMVQLKLGRLNVVYGENVGKMIEN